MTDESGPCFQLTGTRNDNVVQVRRCVHCVYTGVYMCTKFNVPIMLARGMGCATLCDGTGIDYVYGLSTTPEPLSSE